MKLLRKHIATALLSIAVAVVFGNVSFAHPAFGTTDKVSAVSEVQKNGQNNPFVFNEQSIGEASQTVSPNEYSGLGLLGMFCSNQDFFFSRVSSVLTSTYSLKDKRELIFRHLYPFHFFW